MAKVEVNLHEYTFAEVWRGDGGKWRRIHQDEIADYQQKEASNYDVYASAQRYKNSNKVQGEDYIAPLYFDLDSADPAESQADAIKLVDFLTKELDVQPTDLYIFFSGSKGFHIIIDYHAFAIKPRADLVKAYKHLAGYLVHRLELKTLDLVVYTNPRMLRLPGSVHAKTKLFKTELSIEELKSWNIEQIKVMAAAPRPTAVINEEIRATSRGIRKKLSSFYTDKEAEYQQLQVTTQERYKSAKYNFERDKYPACVEDILTGGWKQSGQRNQATVQLACFFKDAGYTKDEALKILEEWVRKHTSAKNGSQVERRIANTRSVVDAVFSKENEYSFGCAFIRSLHGDKTPGNRDYERVKCAGDMCPCIQGSQVEESDIPELHLAETASAEYTGKLVRTKVLIAGKRQSPYIVPSKVEYTCWGAKKCKNASCPLLDLDSHTGYKYLGTKDRELIQMTGIGDDNLNAILRNIAEIPECRRFNIEIIETMNVDELLVIPMAETGTDDTGRYVLRKIYSTGGVNIDENRYYEIEGYVYPHPKNQEGTILVKSAKPLQDVVEAFQYTPDVHDQLKVFTPTDITEEAIIEKVATICNDLTYNVTKIVERDEALIAILLTQHSVLRLNVPWDTQAIRGWIESVIIGDTGTGKSAMVDKLLRYAGLGTKVNAECTARTGLTYKMEQSGGSGNWYIVWGAWPLADKELLWIDEASGITKDEYGQMTMARSEGRLEVKKAVTAETSCRVRAILTGNVNSHGGIRRLADYGSGCESLKDIFNPEDIRRFDLGVFMRRSDVDPDKYNQELPTFPVTITGDMYKNNVLFAWSRKPEQVKFPTASINRIREAATKLSKLYGNADDVPLVSPSDQRNKVARMAAALATMLHMTDETGENVIVHPACVDFIVKYLHGIYRSNACGLNHYNLLNNNSDEMTEARFDKIENRLRLLDTFKRGDDKLHALYKLFAQNKYLRIADLAAMLAVDDKEARPIVATLVGMQMVQSSSGGLRKTPRFNAFLSMCFERGLFDSDDDI